MNVTAFSKKIENDQIRLDIEFPPAEFEKHFETLAGDYASKLKLPGFRQGKVPLSVVKTRFKDTLQSEALEKVLPEVISQAIKQESLEVFGSPMLNPGKDGKSPFEHSIEEAIKKSKPIKFSVNFYLPPEVKMKSLSSVVLRDHSVQITDSEIEEEIERETLPYSKLTEVKDTIQYKDLIKANITFTDTAFEKYNLTEHNFMYGSSEGGAQPTYLNDLRAVVLEMVSGVTRQATITFDKAQEEVALQKVKTDVQIEILLVKRREKVVFDEDMLKNLKVESEAEYRKQVRERLETLGQKLIERVHVREIFKTLVHTGKFRVPELAVDNYVKHEWQQYQNQISQYLKQQGGDMKALENSLPKEPSEDWIKTTRVTGAKAIREMLIFEEFKKSYSSEVEESRIEEHLQELAKQYGQTDVEAFRKELIQAGHFSQMKEQLAQEAIWKKVIKNCKHKKGTLQPIKALEALASDKEEDS